MAGKGGGAWKVAYADFVTAMMAFFMVMWLVGQKSDVKEAIADYFQQPPPLGSALPFRNGSVAPPAAMPTRDVGPTKVRATDRDPGSGNTTSRPAPNDLHKGPGPSTPPRPRSVGFDLKEDATIATQVLFVEDSAELSAAGRALLDQILPQMLGKANRIEIRGHATRRPLPSDRPYRDAWQLSFARCEATMQFLIESGIEPWRIRLSQVGPFDPRTSSLDPAEQARNSCVEVQLLNTFARRPADGSEPASASPSAADHH